MGNLRRIFEQVAAEKSPVVVVGLGISGIGVLELCHDLTLPVIAIEALSEEKYRPPKDVNFAALRACPQFSFYWECPASSEPPSFIMSPRKPRLAVVSPGISFEAPLPRALQAEGLQLCTELELGLELLGLPSVVVTGSNGKSTTVCLIHHLLRSLGTSSVLCGNIGTPVVSAVRAQCVRDGRISQAPAAKVVVVEASSYQLEQCESLSPQVSVLLNLSDNHLERHGSMEAYGAAKARVARWQGPEQVCVLNAEDSFCGSSTVRTSAARYWFGANSEFSQRLAPGTVHALVDYDPAAGIDRIALRVAGESAAKAVFSLSELKLIGFHNRTNVAAALLAVKGMGVDVASHTLEIERAFRTFEPLPHRLQLCAADARGRQFLNDSKSTTVASTVEALKTCAQHYPGRPIVVMLGGQAKRGSWAPLAAALNQVRDRISEVVFFGRDGIGVRQNLNTAGLDGSVRTFDAVHLRGAVARVIEEAPDGSLVLLSPGCASFDEFTGFEARGEAFVHSVKEGTTLLVGNR